MVVGCVIIIVCITRVEMVILELSLVQLAVALQLGRTCEPGVAEMADVGPEGCVGLEMLK